jgi:chromate transporter
MLFAALRDAFCEEPPCRQNASRGDDRRLQLRHGVQSGCQEIRVRYDDGPSAFAWSWPGVTSFGGPVAHLGYYRAEFVERRKWLDEIGYVDIVALCQFLPGPASSQVAVTLGGIAHVPWLHGLKIVAVAVIAQAVWGMARNLCPDRERATVVVSAALLALFVPSAAGQIGAIAAGALIGWYFFPAAAVSPPVPLAVRIPRPLAALSLGLFFVLLFGLPLLAAASTSHALALVSSFYRSGALVFGGGHVVLPLLQQAVVPPGWVSNDVFLAGYGAAQAVPGPLFTFAAYLGNVMEPPPNGWVGGLICLLAIYLPSFLLLMGILPYWDGLRARAGVRSALTGVNALVMWRVPPWLVVILGALGAALLAAAY